MVDARIGRYQGRPAWEWMAKTKPDVAIVVYNDHSSASESARLSFAIRYASGLAAVHWRHATCSLCGCGSVRVGQAAAWQVPCCRRLRPICFPAEGEPKMSALRFARIAALSVLATALGLAGCGRKGGLDLPPGATPSETSVSRPDLEPAIGPDGRVIAPSQGPKRSTPLDFLLN